MRMTRLDEQKNRKSLQGREDEYFSVGLPKLNDWRPSPKVSSDADFQVVDMFSGCGGMSLGFAALGNALGSFDLVGAVDINDYKTYLFLP